MTSKLNTKISERERACLNVLAELYYDHDDQRYTFYKRIADDTKLTLSQARRSVRALVRKGLAEYRTGLINEETGMLAGSGHCATKQGAWLIRECQKCHNELVDAVGDVNCYECNIFN